MLSSCVCKVRNHLPSCNSPKSKWAQFVRVVFLFVRVSLEVWQKLGSGCRFFVWVGVVFIWLHFCVDVLFIAHFLLLSLIVQYESVFHWRNLCISFVNQCRFNSTDNSKRKVQLYLYWRIRLGPKFPILDDLLASTWKYMETCAFGYKYALFFYVTLFFPSRVDMKVFSVCSLYALCVFEWIWL